jgi:hypothetical protein
MLPSRLELEGIKIFMIEDLFIGNNFKQTIGYNL